MSPPVFLTSSALIIVFVIYGTVFTSHASVTFERVQGFLVTNFGWFYILSVTVILVFVIFLAISPLGRIRLGEEHSKPEFNNLSWFAMLMAAGMGIGLVFFGVAEPIEHYLAPVEADARSGAAIRDAMFYTYFHWGFHPWAIYISFGLPLAYFHFRHGLPMAPRSLLYPIIGGRIYGWAGHLVDVLATVGTLFGLGTSLGLGAMQINAGLNELANVPMDVYLQILIITVITIIATISVIAGLKAGIRRLSQFNMSLAGVIMIFVVIFGPTLYIFETFTSSLGYYLQNLPEISLRVEQEGNGKWQADWTLFYWSWWIAWSPFVGIFTARISRGRTVRQFVAGMLIVPTVIGFFWFAAAGGTALYIEHFGPGGIAGPTLEDEALSLFAMLQHLPFTAISSAAGVLLIVIFFVTSSDSGSFVNVMVTSGGHPNPSTIYRVFWCVIEGVVAATLLYAGGLTALRTASLTPALPMTVFLLVASYGLFWALQMDARKKGRPSKGALKR